MMGLVKYYKRLSHYAYESRPGIICMRSRRVPLLLLLSFLLLLSSSMSCGARDIILLPIYFVLFFHDSLTRTLGIYKCILLSLLYITHG